MSGRSRAGLLCAGALLLSLAGAARAGEALVTAQLAGELAFVDLKAGRVSGTLALDGAPAGIALSPDRNTAYVTRPEAGAVELWARRVVTFALVCLGWVFFRSETPAEAWAVLGSLAEPRGAASIPLLAQAVLVAGVLAHLPPRSFKDAAIRRFGGLPAPLQGASYALAVGLFLELSGLRVPFIYFQF